MTSTRAPGWMYHPTEGGRIFQTEAGWTPIAMPVSAAEAWTGAGMTPFFSDGLVAVWAQLAPFPTALEEVALAIRTALLGPSPTEQAWYDMAVKALRVGAIHATTPEPNARTLMGSYALWAIAVTMACAAHLGPAVGCVEHGRQWAGVFARVSTRNESEHDDF